MNYIQIFITICLFQQILTSPTRSLSGPTTVAKDNDTIVIETDCGKHYFHATVQHIHIYNNGPAIAAAPTTAAPTTTAAPPTTTLPYCEDTDDIPEGYIVTPGVGAHKYHATKRNWNDARNVCIKEGGHLAVIDSLEEEKLFVQHLTDQQAPGGVWMGLHCHFNPKEWVTVLDKPLDSVGYVHWNPNEPNNASGKEKCVEITKGGGLNDLACDNEKHFICEYNLD